MTRSCHSFLVQLVRLNLGPPCGVGELPVKPYYLIEKYHI
jgi:hypothetical protein